MGGHAATESQSKKERLNSACARGRPGKPHQQTPQKLAIMRIHVGDLKSQTDALDVPPHHDCATKRFPTHLDSNPTGSTHLDIFRAMNQHASRAGINQFT
jgi:hypothetical protein